MANSPHRDPGVAASARIVQLEDEIRALRGTLPVAPRSRWKRRWLFGAGALVLSTLALAWWASKPASQTVMRTNPGVSLTVIFRASVDDLHFETEDGHTPIPMLTQPAFDSDGHQVSVRGAGVLIKDSLLAKDGPTRIRVRYKFFGIPRSAVLEFRALEDGNRSMQQMLDGIPQWVAFREYGGQTLVYFTTMLVYKPTLREIRWGLDDEPLDRSVHFTQGDALGVDSSDEMYASVPHATKQVRVQLTYRDGSRSAVRTILRSDAEIP